MHLLEIEELKKDPTIKGYWTKFTLTSTAGDTVNGIAYITENYITDELPGAAYYDANENVLNEDVAKFLSTKIEELRSKPIDSVRLDPYLIFACRASNETRTGIRTQIYNRTF